MSRIALHNLGTFQLGETLMSRLFIVSILSGVVLTSQAFATETPAASSAQGPLTRAQVIQETLHAIKTSTMPDQERPAPFNSTRSRAEVKAEVQAMRVVTKASDASRLDLP